MSGFQMKFKKRNPDFKKPPKKAVAASPHTVQGGAYPVDSKRPGSSAKPAKQTAVASSSSSSEEDFVERKKTEQAKENAEKSEQAKIVERALLEQVMNGQLNLMDLLAGDSQAKGLLESKLTPEMIQGLVQSQSNTIPSRPPAPRQQFQPPPFTQSQKDNRRSDERQPRRSTERQSAERQSTERQVERQVERHASPVERQPRQQERQPSYPPQPVAQPVAQPPVVTRAALPSALSLASISSESDSASDLSISSESYTDSDDTENPVKLKKRVKKLRSSNKKLKKSVKKMKKKMKAKDKTISDLQGAAAAVPVPLLVAPVPVAPVPVREQRKANVVKPQIKQQAEPDTVTTQDRPRRKSPSHTERSRDSSTRDSSHRDSHKSSRRDRDSPRKHRKHRSDKEKSDRDRSDKTPVPDMVPQAPPMMTSLPNQQIYDPQTGQYRNIPNMSVPLGPMPTMPPLSSLGPMPPLSSMMSSMPPLSSVMPGRPPLLACPPGPPPSIASLTTPSIPPPSSLLPTPSEDDLYSDVFNSSERPKREAVTRSFSEAQPVSQPKQRLDSGGDTERDSRGYPLCMHCKRFHSKNVRCRKQAMKHAEQTKSRSEEKKMSDMINERERELTALKNKKELRERIKADSFARSSGYGNSARSDVYDIDDCLDGECLDGEEYIG